MQYCHAQTLRRNWFVQILSLFFFPFPFFLEIDMVDICTITTLFSQWRRKNMFLQMDGNPSILKI
jgi:hypothetical protein